VDCSACVDFRRASRPPFSLKAKAARGLLLSKKKQKTRPSFTFPLSPTIPFRKSTLCRLFFFFSLNSLVELRFPPLERGTSVPASLFPLSPKEFFFSFQPATPQPFRSLVQSGSQKSEHKSMPLLAFPNPLREIRGPPFEEAAVFSFF